MKKIAKFHAENKKKHEEVYVGMLFKTIFCNENHKFYSENNDTNKNGDFRPDFKI